jgi:Zn-dependent metalloprotease
VYTTVIPTDPADTMPVISTTYYVYANGENAGDVFAAMSNLAEASTVWVSTTKTATDLKSKSRTITVEYQPSSKSYRFNDVTRSVSTYAASSTSTAPGTLVTKASWSGWNRSAVSAQANTEVVYDYYLNTLGRSAFDGLGSSLRVSTLPSTFNNAYWDPSLKILVFGHDFEAALDVVGHEYTHGVVQYAVAGGNGLIYQGESGALNESYADILGSLIENKTGTARWQIAEDYRCGKWSGCAIRDMSDPAKYGQPTNYANRYTGTADYGGVHTNNGIFSFAAYKMMTDSRTSTVSSATWGAVFYGSLYKLPTNATFADGRAAVLNTAKDLGFTTTQQQAITDAFNAVGIPNS